MPSTRVMRRLLRIAAARVGLAILAMVILGAALAGLLPFDPTMIDLPSALQPPSWTHIFGTDELGRDLFTRIAFGARTSLAVSAGAVALGALVGTAIGIAAGYFGGRVDAAAVQAVNVLGALPTVLLALFFIAIVGPDAMNLVLAIAITSLPVLIRLVRGLVLVLRSSDYILAARAAGCTDWRISVAHIFPNTVGSLTVQCTFLLAGAVQLTAGLSFLGIGVPPPTPEWGAILSEGRNYVQVAPYLTIIPGLMLLLVLVSLNLLGDTLRDALDPRSNI
jgi:ABC-type dipeptide/oligopeptide/nickel transport system permease subunit